MGRTLLLGLCVCAAVHTVQAQPPPPGAGTEHAPAIDTQVDTPPPSTWDRLNRPGAAPQPVDTGFGAELLRSLLALIVVVGLIYIVVKLGLPRLLRLAGVQAGGGRYVRVVERVQLDTRHALFLVEVAKKQTYLLGAGEQGVRLIAQVDVPSLPPAAAAPQRSFRALLGQEHTDTPTVEEKEKTDDATR